MSLDLIWVATMINELESLRAFPPGNATATTTALAAAAYAAATLAAAPQSATPASTTSDAATTDDTSITDPSTALAPPVAQHPNS